ncbi:MAG TPA: protein kinase, partial [Candidatus Polarisedimenticolia bacterium]|nr:protein kinase [Candidatus Polarisedimenticolia bacterium]
DADALGQLHYLVMELLEGESLADRLRKGPLPLSEVLKYGRQIASALEAAHRQGIVHRDLKPGNIMLTKSGAKLLDFGLARTAAGEPPPLPGSAGTGSHLQTALAAEARPLTSQGTIVGTFQYMAPEQLEGTEADARTDIFALGAVLYEMATGTRAFQGHTKTSLIAAIVSAHPAPISTVLPMTPPGLDHVVKRCLEKDPDERWQSALDVAAELQWIGESGSQAGASAPVTARRAVREKTGWAAAALLALSTIALGIGYLSRPHPPPPRAFRATLPPPPDSALIPFDLMGLALSPDGGTLAFVAVGSDGRRQIWLRNLSEMDARRVPETDGATYPFWSPDGRSLGFFSDATLKTIDLRGGSPRNLADAPTGRGGTWSAAGVILFAPNLMAPIHRVSAAGGKAEPVTAFDPETEITHRWPLFLPDGRHFVYVSRVRAAESREVGRLMLASIDSPEASLLVEDASNAAYVEPGSLIYGRSANLYAWRFDARSLRLEGQPVPIVQEKLSYWEPKNFIPFAASHDRTIVYLPESDRLTQMRWYDRQGRPLGALGPPAAYVSPRISPDGRKIAYMRGDSAQSLVDIWLHDLDFNRSFRLTQQSGLYTAPAWTPDSERIAFVCQPKGVQDLCVTSVSGGGEPRLLYQSDTWKGTGSWMPDGRRFLFSTQDPRTDMDIAMLPDGGGAPEPVLATPFTELNAQVSPDGRRMAYVTDQSGRPEVYLRTLEGPSGQWQISTEGGHEPRWRSDGRELFYAAADGYLMSVSFQAGADLRPGAPVRL